ncbi:MAG: hypothetical protein WDO19_09785 [Bacteroidota bacterium]
MLNKQQKVKECDARDDDSSNTVGSQFPSRSDGDRQTSYQTWSDRPGLTTD